jgi:hypothetical protein
MPSRLNVAGDQSVAIGVDALANQNPVGNADMNNVAVGFQAALCTTTGTTIRLLVACALRLEYDGLQQHRCRRCPPRNTRAATTRSWCSARQHRHRPSAALRANTTGAATPLRANRSCSNTTGCLQRSDGHDALRENVEGDQSVAIGNDALRNQNPVGNADMNNVAVGYQAALCTTTGCQNTAVGSCALTG